MLGALLPIAAARTKRLSVPPLAFFITKYFGSGVIIATAFIHLLAPASENLTSPCLKACSSLNSWHHDLTSITRIQTSGEGPSRGRSSIPGRPDDLSYPPGGEDHLGHQREHHQDDDHFAAQMTALFILEFGVIFHSIFIGLTLAVTGDDFVILYIVLVFHQTFEGLGLGARLATAHWPKKKSWMPWVLGSAYGFTTPIAIAIGLGVRTTFTPGSQNTMIVNGVFDSISAGILIYTGLVELMAHEFMFNQEMRKSSMKMLLFAFGCMCAGAGLMALLGKWA
ncbi:hypothetical protein EYC84_008091 [Monilinia fructicola]|uniref:ZIP zinc/iron transport family n=1 Tax=Monilinia fructicola TaxID=38448 RepID=A0A5M9JIQ5_MONFR|nr:hypothetical protein EYC84_008091 [Monilinia fructicola]